MKRKYYNTLKVIKKIKNELYEIYFILKIDTKVLIE